MRISDIVGFVGVAGLLAACAQSEPEMIRPQPVFDKFGGGACVEGYVYVPGSVPELAECIPEDDCEETVNADGSVVPCPPPPPRRDDDDDSSTSGGRPGGGSSAPPGTAPRT